MLRDVAAHGGDLRLGGAEDQHALASGGRVWLEIVAEDFQGSRLLGQGLERRRRIGLGPVRVQGEDRHQRAVVAERQGHPGVLEIRQIQFLQDAGAVVEPQPFGAAVEADDAQGVGRNGRQQLRDAFFLDGSVRFPCGIPAAEQERQGQKQGESRFFAHNLQIY